jgi:pimeloyl-ACP methyl ester carboxylesterase
MDPLAYLLASGLSASAAACAATAVTIAHRFTTPRRVRPTAPGEAHGHTVQRVQFHSVDAQPVSLVGWLVAPPSSTRAVILVHGRDSARGGELRSSTAPLVAALTAAAYTVLLIDLRGHGESDGRRTTYGLAEQADVVGAIRFLGERGFAPSVIGVLGASMGGAAAVGAASTTPELGALIIDSAFADFDLLLTRQFSRLTGIPHFFYAPSQLAAHALTGAPLRRFAPVRAARALTATPVMVIHARHDPFVPVTHAVALADAANAELWITDCRVHLGSFQQAPAIYISRVMAFLAQHLPAIAHTPRRHEPESPIERHTPARLRRSA